MTTVFVPACFFLDVKNLSEDFRRGQIAFPAADAAGAKLATELAPGLC